MTGRARGRARGRSRGSGTLESVRPGPGEKPQAPTTEAQIGPGRGSRSRGTAPTQQQPPKQAPQQVSPPVEEMAAMGVSQKSPPATTPATAGRGTGGRGRGGAEPVTRPVHIQDKRGTTGQEINVVSNYIRMMNRPNCALYQYNVTYAPHIESKRLRLALLYSYQGIGQTKAFDGMILYLPHKLPDQVTKFTTTTQRDQTRVEVCITLTNELSADSPICLQLFNVIFRR